MFDIDARVSRRGFLARSGGVLLASGLGTTLGACGGEAATESGSGRRRGGRLLISVTDGQERGGLDPLELGDSLGTLTGGLIYEALTLVDKSTFEVRPLLAESWEASPDYRTWTFTLRDGLTFNDGKPVSVDDVVWSLRRGWSEPDSRKTLERFFDARDVRRLDARKLRIELKRPHVYIDGLVGRSDVVVLPEGTRDFSMPVGTGPFALRRRGPNFFDLARNENYWQDGLPYLDAVRLTLVPEQNTKVETVVSGDAHLGDPAPSKLARLFEGDPGLQPLTLKDGAFRPIVLRERKGPFGDPRVGQALKHLVDRERIKELAFGGRATVSPDIAIAPSDPLFPSDLPVPAYDPDRARFLLRQAGEENLRIELGTADVQSGMNDIAVLFKDTAAPAGVSVDVQQEGTQSYFDTFTRFPAAMSTWAKGAIYTYLPLLYVPGSDYNETGYDDPRAADLLLSAISEPDEERRKQVVLDAAQLIQETRSEIIPVHLDEVWPKKRALQGVQGSLQSFWNFREAYLDG